MSSRAQNSPLGWPNHVGLVVTAGVFALIVLRVLAVARFNADTAKAIVQHAGGGDLLVEIAYSAFPGLVAMSAGGVLGWIVSDIRRRPVSALEWTLLVIILLVATVTVSVGLLVGLTVVAVVLAALARYDRQRGLSAPGGQPGDERDDQRGRYLLAALGVGSALLTLSGPPWLAAETITRAGQPPTLGYVLDQSEAGLVVLTYDDGRVKMLPGRHFNRSLCTPPVSWLSQTFVDLLDTDPNYPDCSS